MVRFASCRQISSWLNAALQSRSAVAQRVGGASARPEICLLQPAAMCYLLIARDDAPGRSGPTMRAVTAPPQPERGPIDADRFRRWGIVRGAPVARPAAVHPTPRPRLEPRRR